MNDGTVSCYFLLCLCPVTHIIHVQLTCEVEYSTLNYISSGMFQETLTDK